jgi:hypothetical protein
VYSQDVVFREIKDVVKHEVLPRKEEPDPHTPILRRLVRERRQLKRYTPPNFHSNFALFITEDDPRTVREVVDLDNGKLWKKDMIEEMAILKNNETWDLMEFLTKRKPISNKWVFKKKLNVEGKVEKYKARLIEKFYSQLKESTLVRFFLLLLG